MKLLAITLLILMTSRSFAQEENNKISNPELKRIAETFITLVNNVDVTNKTKLVKDFHYTVYQTQNAIDIFPTQISNYVVNDAINRFSLYYSKSRIEDFSVINPQRILEAKPKTSFFKWLKDEITTDLDLKNNTNTIERILTRKRNQTRLSTTQKRLYTQISIYNYFIQIISSDSSENSLKRFQFINELLKHLHQHFTLLTTLSETKSSSQLANVPEFNDQEYLKKLTSKKSVIDELNIQKMKKEKKEKKKKSIAEANQEWKPREQRTLSGDELEDWLFPTEDDQYTPPTELPTPVDSFPE